MHEFSHPSQFSSLLLPRLVALPGELVHVVATPNWIGPRPPAHIVEVAYEPALRLRSIRFTDLVQGTIDGMAREVMCAHVNPTERMLATVYLSSRQFYAMHEFVRFLRSRWPDAVLVALACHCTTPEQERGLRDGTIDHLVRSECGGSADLGMIHDAVRGLRITAVAPRYATPCERAAELSPDA